MLAAQATRVIHDPAHIILRKATRAALIVPAVFAGALVVTDDDTLALFAVFGAFAALAMTDFGGPLARRFRAYLGLLLVGLVLIPIGTAASESTIAATIATVIVVFVVTLAAIFGGYWAVGTTAATLSFVLAVMVPGPVDTVGGRAGGWAIGLAIAAVAAIVCWPAVLRDRIRAATATVARAVARALTAPDAPGRAAALDDVDHALTSLHQQTGTVYRPADGAARDRALAGVIVALDRVTGLARHLPHPGVPVLPEDTVLRAALATTYAATATTLEGQDADVVGLGPLLDARARHTAAMERVAELAVDDAGLAAVLDTFDREQPLRQLVLQTVSIVRDTQYAATGTVVDEPSADALPVPLPLPDAGLARVRRLARVHLDPGSVRFRAALRAALGLAAAVLVARLTGVQHGFWVVLGALTVLRSNALGTGATALQAMLGTVIGFALSTVVILGVGDRSVALWILLPVFVFASAYTPGAVHFVVGQASFTLFVVTLFNILVPSGWETGLIRVEDLAMGALVAVLVGLLLWPRGAHRAVHEAFGALLGAVAQELDRAADHALGTHARVPYARGRRLQGAGARVDATDVVAAHTAASLARTRAVAALETLVSERGGGNLPERGHWVALLHASSVLQMSAIGLGLHQIGDDPGMAVGPSSFPCRATVDDLAAHAHRTVDLLAEAGSATVRDVGWSARHGAGPPGSGSSAPPDPARPSIAGPPLARPSVAGPPPSGLATCWHAMRASSSGSPVDLLWIREWLAAADTAAAAVGSIVASFVAHPDNTTDLREPVDGARFGRAGGDPADGRRGAAPSGVDPEQIDGSGSEVAGR